MLIVGVPIWIKYPLTFPIHDAWPSGSILCPSSASGKFWIFVLVRLVRCASRRTLSDSALSKWLTSLLVRKLPLQLSDITSSVWLLTLSQFSLWCGSSKAFSSYSEVTLLKYLSNNYPLSRVQALFAIVLNSPLLTATQGFWPKSLGLWHMVFTEK